MYKLTDGTSIILTSDGALIPNDSGNTDYQSYLQWLADGNNPVSADVQPEYRQLSALNFLDKFTIDEQFAVKAAMRTNDVLGLWYDKMLAAGYVDLADQRTVDGLSALVEAGLISASRKAEILGV